MSTAELKLSLHQLIDGVSDSSLLEAVYNLLAKELGHSEEDWYDSLTDEGKKSIERGLEDLKNDRTVKHEDAVSRISDRIARFKNA